MEQKTAAVLLIFLLLLLLFWKFTVYLLILLRIIQQLKVTVFTAYWQCDMKDLRIFAFYFLHLQFYTFSCGAESVELAVEA